jgi:hypothetical protein
LMEPAFGTSIKWIGMMCGLTGVAHHGYRVPIPALR